MSDWQSLAIYTTIGAYPCGDHPRRMSSKSPEIDSLRQLDPQTISAIHNQYYPEVYRFVCFRINDQVAAEDITSDVFMRLLEAVHRGNGPKTNLRGWLFATASNAVNDHFRQKYRHPKDEPNELIDESNDPNSSPTDPVMLHEVEERRESLQLALKKLTDAQQMVISLRFSNRFSLEETAKIMGKNINSIKALQFRALDALRKILGRE